VEKFRDKAWRAAEPITQKELTRHLRMFEQ
jgi:hypothetical protein